MEKQGFSLKIKDKINPTFLAKQLVDLGYEKVGISIPANGGQFSIRGGLLDLWLERYKSPVRIDMIGELIENIYLFNPITQAKTKNLKEIYIIPFGATPKLAPKWTKKTQFPAGKGSYKRLFLSDIGVGDLVVHIDHGIGKFLGIKEESFHSKESKKQILVVEYAKESKLFVPINQIERLTKYIGAPGYKPRLNSLGSASWLAIKAKVTESVVKVAQDLLNLYARREISTRQGYSKDTAWQRQLEDSFEFEETDDQIKAIKEIKQDLKNNKPMDRILVGDVGFGKTEVAIRAAFKVVQDGKQVAILVPTTLLAEQHFHLFKNRLKEFPVRVGMLSRFRERQDQTKTLHNLKSGNVDIVIGTHRLLSADVDFKNLGLLIIDEEHRFGVTHKERLKRKREEVDILSMSATPIPRTLHMALSNLRDISTLTKPPRGRKPIKTFIGEFNEDGVRKAINYELKRGGQVYYLFNNVDGSSKKSIEIAALVPSAKIVYAHGRMDKTIQNSKGKSQNLESTMDEFYSGKADVLVCTTIIGSGLDMPNVNTIIIENVQKFGLAEIHQLRGRVGRSDREAYAFLYYPKGYLPVGDVQERLRAIESAKDLGAGFALAKKDLEIRGAGNLLGVAQHGNIALVGYQIYVQLLSQQIEKLKKKNDSH